MKKKVQTDQNRAVKEIAKEMHESLDLFVFEKLSTDYMELFADRFQVQLHVFDVNGIQLEFKARSLRELI